MQTFKCNVGFKDCTQKSTLKSIFNIPVSTKTDFITAIGFIQSVVRFVFTDVIVYSVH